MASAVLLQSLGNGSIWDVFGNALNNHQVFVYQRGTTTQVTVYTDATLTTPLTQPLFTGSNGAGPGGIPGYVAGGRSVDFFDATASLRQPAEPLAASSVAIVGSPSSNLLPLAYAPPPSGGDDTAALQAVFAAGLHVKLAAGVYTISGAGLNLDGMKDMVVEGTGGRWALNAATTLSYTGSGTAISVRGTGGSMNGTILKNFRLVCNSAAIGIDFGTTGTPNVSSGSSNCTLKDCYISSSSTTNILLNLAQAASFDADGVAFSGGGTQIQGMNTGGFSNANRVHNCYFGTATTIPIRNFSNACVIHSNTFEPLASGAAGAYLQDSAIPCLGHLLFEGNWTGDGNGTGTWITFNGWSLTVIGELDPATNGILLNAETRELTVGGYFNGSRINFNGQIVRNFREIGLHGGAEMYTGTSTTYGQGGGMAMGACAVQTQLTSTKAISASTSTALTMDSTVFDTLGANADAQWAVANPTRLTAAAPGLYRVYASVVWASIAASGDRAVWFRKNATTWLAGERSSASSINAPTTQNPSTTVLLNAGDYVECYVWQSSSTNPLNVVVTDSGIGAPTVFGMEKIA